MLHVGEIYIADHGYNDGYMYAMTLTGLQEYADNVQASIRARHKTINGRLKKWRVLSDRWRHAPHKHGVMFRAIATVVQLGLETDERVWDIYYDEHEFRHYH